MTKEELEKVVQGAEYDFLRENPHLGSNIMFLTLGGSHAYGTNVPGSDVDVRGVTGDSKYDLLGFGTFEQVVEQSTDTTIYGFRKLVSLLINCNPNVIEMLGSKPDNYLMVSPEGQMLLDNKALFLSKKALYSFGGYANDQLRRLQMGLLQNDVNTDMNGKFVQEDGTYRQEFFEMVDEYEKRLKYDAENSPLPQKPDMKKIEELVMTVNESLLEKQYKR